MNFNKKYKEYLDFINGKISSFFADYKTGGSCLSIIEAAEYAVFNGGKRVRPILCLAVSEMLGVDSKIALKFALAVEFIHSYSLVHDDLPAMDNDDFRRGKPSTHKKFGEAMGILAGDALLNLAAETVLSGEIDEKQIKAAKFLFDCSGMKGMIAGQVYDIESEKSSDINKEFLYEISENKTAKLITAPLVIPAILSGNHYEELSNLGYNLGVLFQITDDIFDAVGEFNVIGKTPHKDENKITAIKVFGIEGAKKQAEFHYKECKKIIDKLPDNEFLSDFADFIYLRQN